MHALGYVAQKTDGSTNISPVVAWSGLASEYVLLGQYDKANPLVAKALKIIDAPQYAETALFLQTLDQAAKVYLALGRLTDAERFWNRAIVISSTETRINRLPVLIHLAEL